jgi:GWxTD domain-containing protein
MEAESKDFYETARLIMSGDEKAIFNHLPDEASRKEFIQDFWDKRDPDPDTDTNEFRDEFFERIDYANERFDEGTPGWKTDRGRIYIFFGPPDRIEDYPMLNDVNVKGMQIWVYYRYQFGIQFIDTRGDNTYTFNPHSGVLGNFYDALEMAQFGLSQQDLDGFARKFIDFDLEYDSRTKEFVILVPTDKLVFSEEDDLLKADFEFEFFVYKKKSPEKKVFQESRRFEATAEEIIEMKKILFTFALDVEPGKYLIDVIITGKPDLGKSRKIFNLKV